uniref:Putative DnaB domain protein n=1 Tax=viral metagenome TaxID=1070528 RepID=A0A6M3KM76_9ZZZZ
MTGRPVKNTVDYFPHDSSSSEGRTLTILHNHFGHEGYSIWFKLLEVISATNNHIIVINNVEDFEYLAARLKIQPESLRLIVDKIADLNGIDRDLYKQGMIWCQNLVDRLAPVYKRRNITTPTKPLLSTESQLLTTESQLLPSENTHINKVNKVNKSILDINSSEIFKLYESNIGMLTPHIADEIKATLEEYSPEWIELAIKKATELEHRSWGYVKGILKGWKRDGFNQKGGQGGRRPEGTKTDKRSFMRAPSQEQYRAGLPVGAEDGEGRVKQSDGSWK